MNWPLDVNWPFDGKWPLDGWGQRSHAAAGDAGELSHVENALLELEAHTAAYARRDARLALADLSWRTGLREQAAERYRALASELDAEPLRRFCLRRAGDPAG